MDIPGTLVPHMEDLGVEHHNATNDYVKSLFAMMLNVDHARSLNGRLASPTNPNTNIWLCEGIASPTLVVGATSFTTVFEPEITLRSGQLSCTLYEFNSARELISERVITASAPSTEFSAMGVICASMQVKNTSSTQDTAGSLTIASVNFEPKQVHNLSQTNLIQKSNYPTDVTSVDMRTDGAGGFCMTSHIGEKLSTTEALTVSNRSEVTTHWVMKPSTNTAGTTAAGGAPNKVGWSQWAENFLDGGTPTAARDEVTNSAKTRIWDSKYCVDIGQPDVFKHSTRGARIKFETRMKMGQGDYDFCCVILDHAGNIMASEIKTQAAFGSSETSAYIKHSISLDFEFAQMPKAIGRAFIYCSALSTADLSYITASSGSIATGDADEGVGSDSVNSPTGEVTVTSISQDSDIPDRPILVSVGEGVNALASIKISIQALVGAIPSSSNTFVSGSLSRDNGVNDTAVQGYLKTVGKMVRRTYALSTAEEYANTIGSIHNMPEHSELLEAFSFSDIAKAVSSAARMGYDAVRRAQGYIRSAKPIIKNISTVSRGLMDTPGVDRIARSVNQFSTRAERMADLVAMNRQPGAYGMRGA